MTLIINEIHILNGFNRTMLVFAADRRLSNLDGSFGALRRKLFKIPHLSGGVSYFGLAKVRNTYLSDWLTAFITKSAHLRTLRDFSTGLRNELNRDIPADTLRAHFSGFHICGYDQNGIPEFWFLTNIGGMENFQYTNLQPQYTEASSDFLGRDATALGWDGISLNSVANRVAVQTYQNGDFRAHAAAWDRLDEIFTELLVFPDFKRLKTSDDYARWVKFKFEFIRNFYRRFATSQIIGGPIDVIVESKILT